MTRRPLTLAFALACAPHGEPIDVRPTPAIELVPTPAAAPPTAAPPTTWTTLTVAPGCSVQIADAPATLDPPLVWHPCAEPQGCRALLTRPDIDGHREVAGLAHGGRITIVATFSGPGPRVRHVLAPIDGAPFFAVEGPRDEQCTLAGVDLTDDGAVVEIEFDNLAGFASRAYLRGPLRDDPAWRTVAATLPRREFPTFIGESAFSAGGRVVVEQNGGPLRWYDDAARRWVEVPGSRGHWECCARGHGDIVTFLLATIPETAMVARLGEPARPLRRGVDGVSPVALDGRRAAWIEGRGRDRNNFYERVELWYGELSDELSLESAELAAVLPRRTMATPVLGGGAVAVPPADRGEQVTVVRLGVPEIRTLDPHFVAVFERILWITADEVAVQFGPDESEPDGPTRLLRVPLAALRPLPQGS